MKVKDVSGVKVYDLTVGKTLPQWLSDKQRRSLSKDEGNYVVMGFEFAFQPS
jgi:ribosome biogenesis protein ENP2